MRRSTNDNNSGSGAHRRSAHRGRRLLGWAMTAALGLLFGSQASAGTSTGVIEWLNFPTLEVVSDGHHFTGVDQSSYDWEARIVIEAAGIARVKSWSVYPELEFPPPAFEAEVIRETLRHCAGNQTLAAQRLGLSRNGLLKKMIRLRI